MQATFFLMHDMDRSKYCHDLKRDNKSTESVLSNGKDSYRSLENLTTPSPPTDVLVSIIVDQVSVVR
jgi:hypothetical protein